MTTLHDLESFVRTLKPSRRRKAQPKKAKPANGNAGNGGNSAESPLAASLSRARAMSSPGAYRALAFSRPLDYEIPGIVSPQKQPSKMACWATTYTVLMDWRQQKSASIETRLGAIGQKWVDLFKSDTGASAEQEAEFYAACGLDAEPLKNPTLEGWEGLLRAYGPLAVIVDVDPSDKRAIHMLLMTGIHGDGTPDGTTVTIVDPARGDKRPVKFSAFLAQYEQGVTRRTASGRFSQIVHWPKDVKFAGANSVAMSVRAFTGKPPQAPVTPSAPAAPQPWSNYFQFRKGSNFEVDGPLSYNGTGTVLERTNDFLKFTMKMPGISIFGYDIPAADMVLEATYKKEGKGNLVRATINGQVLEDADAEIVSSGNKRTIRPKFSGAAGPLPEWISVAPDGADEIDLDMRIDGRDIDFDLNRTSGSSGMALGVDPWSQSFPFSGGTLFTVNGPLSFDGRGRVHERSDTFLKFEINMPAATIVNKKIPKLDLILEATYAKEGTGNQLVLTVNGTRHADANASITTHGRTRRTIVPSITIPNVNLGMISFEPDGKDEIDFDVNIDGTEHDFDLEKVVNSSAQSFVRGFGASSTAADALREVGAFSGRTSATKWKIGRADVAKRLTDVVNNPDLVDQGALNLCGPAAFFHLVARRDPVTFVKYAADLFEKGSGSVGSLKVTPDADLVSNNYASIVPRMGSSVTPVAEWMTLSALRGSENSITDFEGDPDENVAGMTTPAELAKWMKATGIYTKVTDEGNWVLTKGMAHATALRPGPNRDIVLLINANILSVPGGKKKLIDSFPNHYIQLLSPITATATGVEFDYWTWGARGHAVVSTKTFTDNYYGSVTGDL